MNHGSVASGIKSIDVLVTTLCRPNLLRMLAESLAAQVDYSHLNIRTILFADSVHTHEGVDIGDPEKAKECIALFRDFLPNANVQETPYNLGICGNFARIVSHMMSSASDAFIFMEEDLVLRNDYVNVLTRLIDFTKNNPLVDLVSGVPGLALSLAEQRRRSSDLVPLGHKWSFGVSAQVVARLGPHLIDYLDFCAAEGFLCNGLDKPDAAQKVRAYLSRYFYPKAVAGIGPDAAIDVMLARLGMHSVCTCPSYGMSTGREGAHFTTSQFERMHLHEVAIYDGEAASWTESSVWSAISASAEDLQRKFLQP